MKYVYNLVITDFQDFWDQPTDFIATFSSEKVAKHGLCAWLAFNNYDPKVFAKDAALAESISINKTIVDSIRESTSIKIDIRKIYQN